VATERRSLTRPDGRVIEFLVTGPEDGLPLVLHEGWRDDDLAFVKDWGFSLGWASPAPVPADPAPVAVWQGDQDRMVPFAHGQWLAAAVRGARVHLMPGDGHLSLTVRAFDRILDDLLDLAGLGRNRASAGAPPAAPSACFPDRSRNRP
jgi:pimeloyl-ACP methyl ester carboxylesterase